MPQAATQNGQQTFSDVQPILSGQSFTDVAPIIEEKKDDDTLIKRLEKWFTTPTQTEIPGNVPGVEQEPEGMTNTPQQSLHRGLAASTILAAPATISALVAAPVATGLALAGSAVGGYAGSKAGGYVGEKVGAPELGSDVGGLAGSFFGGMAGGKLAGPLNTEAVKTALGRSLSAAEAEAPHPSGEMIPALNNTPREVLEYAKQNGINLTPGQATGDPLAQNLEKSGRLAAIGGKDLDAAVNQSKTQFGQAVRKFVEDADPKRMGLSSEQAGETVQRTAKIAKQVAHDNAAQGYEKIGYLMDAPVEGSPISSAWNKIKGDLPMGAEESILAQTPRSMRAVVEDLLSGKPEGFKPTVQETIQLRKFFRDLGDTEGLPDKTQATYKKMEGAASSALDATAAKNNATQDWQAANAGWKDYVGKYGDPKSTLYKILSQRDPTKIVTAMQNAPATDIELLRNEKMDAALEPLKRQVVQEIAQNRFNVGRDGLGGYSDSYLKALFGPEKTKELYIQANLARRLNYDPNPSGTAASLQSLDQLKPWNQAKMGLAAKLSMPRDPLSYLPPSSTASGAGRGATTAPITLRSPQTISISGAPYTLKTDSLGVKWAETPSGVRISVPKGMGEAEIVAKLKEQAEAQNALKIRLKGGS